MPEKPARRHRSSRLAVATLPKSVRDHGLGTKYSPDAVRCDSRRRCRRRFAGERLWLAFERMLEHLVNPPDRE
jgi:hypothetical protein